MDRLWELYRDLGNSLDLDETLSTLDRALVRLVDYDAISIHVDGEDVPAYARAATGDLARLTRCPPEVLAPGFRAAVSVPLKWRGRSAGLLTLYRAPLREFADDDLAMVHALAPKLAACIENARRFRQTQGANKRAFF